MSEESFDTELLVRRRRNRCAEFGRTVKGGLHKLFGFFGRREQSTPEERQVLVSTNNDGANVAPKSKRCAVTVFRGSYALAGATSNFFSLAGSLYSVGALYRLFRWRGLLAAAGIFVIPNFITEYCFGGASIRKRFLGKSDGGINNPGLKKTAIVLEAVYLLLSTVVRVSDRTLLFSDLCFLFGWDFVSPAVLVALGITIVTNLSFSMTNDVGESCQAIVKAFKGGLVPSPPFYACLFKGIKNKVLREMLKILGSAEHMGQEMLAILLLPAPFLLPALKKNIFLTIPIVTLTLLLAPLLFIQTYLFEGKHTEQAQGWFGENDNRKSDSMFCRTNIAKRFLKVLKFLLNASAFVHGGVDATYVFLTLRLFELPLWISLPPTVAVGILRLFGNKFSEVWEAQSWCDKKIAKIEALNRLSIIQNEEEVFHSRLLPT